MKIITNNAVYLQKYYINLLIKSTIITDCDVPISIYNIIDNKTYTKCSNKDFIKFSEKEEVEFLKNSDWIIDYNEYINKSIDEIQKEINDIDLDYQKINEYYGTLNSKKRKEEYNLYYIKVMMLSYKRESLIDILHIKEDNKNTSFNKDIIFGRILKMKKILNN